MAPEEFTGMTSKFFTAMAYMGASIMLIQPIRNFIPSELLEDYLYCYIECITKYFTNTFTMVIEEYIGLTSNEIYGAAEIYVGSKISPLTRRIKVSKPQKEEKLSTIMDENEEVFDVFNGVKFEWNLIRAKRNQSDGTSNTFIINTENQKTSSTHKYFTLRFHKKHKQMVLDEYLPYILKESKSIKEEKKTLKIFTINFDGLWYDEELWTPIKFNHPANFDKLAMDSKLKETIIDDLDRFVERKEFYKRVGKAWKRGYLLYGPPGTGKSSLIAAMANHLNFDVYDLELTEIPRNSHLRSILATANRSILVVEDIDCSVDFENRQGKKKKKHKNKNKVTLSGFLNFTDGLWSSAGDERIIVFTTNHKEKLDPALLRPGRMDMHIHMSYCTPSGFRTLASNYLKIQEHPLFEEIENLIDKAEVTPAEVAEQLMKGDDPSIVLPGLIEFLHEKKNEHDEAKEKATKKAEEKKKKKETENLLGNSLLSSIKLCFYSILSKNKKNKENQDDDSSDEENSRSGSSSSSSSSDSSDESDDE